jgi:hypothetical protein
MAVVMSMEKMDRGRKIFLLLQTSKQYVTKISASIQLWFQRFSHPLQSTMTPRTDQVFIYYYYNQPLLIFLPLFPINSQLKNGSHVRNVAKGRQMACFRINWHINLRLTEFSKEQIS